MKKNQFWQHEKKLFFSKKSWFLYLIFLLPLCYSLLFGYIYKENVVNHIPLIVYDADNTGSTRALIEAYDTSDRFFVLRHASSLEEMTEAVTSGEAYTGVYIPPHFTSDIKTGKQAHLGIYINSTNLVFGNAALASHKEITTAMLVRSGQKLSEAIGLMTPEALETAYPIHLRTRVLYNPTAGYTNFMLLGLIANGIQVSIFLTAANLLCREYRRIRECSHISSARIISTRFFITWIGSFLSMMLCFIVAHYVFFVPFKAPLWQFILLGGGFTFLFTSICFFLSAAITNPVVGMQIPLVYIMPGLLYSGMSWPEAWMNTWSTYISNIMPITYFGIPLRELSLRGYALEYWSNLGSMVGAGIVLLLLTYVVFSYMRRRYEAKEASRYE